jgi:hypothetical protein
MPGVVRDLRHGLELITGAQDELVIPCFETEPLFRPGIECEAKVGPCG